MPEILKTFRKSNYDGSQSKISQFTTIDKTDTTGNTSSYTDNNFHNLTEKDGWYLKNIHTDLEQDEVLSTREYIQKEGRWYAYINAGFREVEKDLDNFSVQGLGSPSLNDPTVGAVEDTPDITNPSTSTTFGFDVDYINDPED